MKLIDEDKETGSMKAMHCFAIFLIVTTLVVGCGSSMEDRLVGRWLARPGGATQETEDPEKEQGLSGLLRGVVENAARSTEFELVMHDDGSGTRTKRVLGFAQQEGGYWRVQELEEGNARLQMASDKEFSNFEEWTIRWIDNDRFTAEVPDFGQLTFERQVQN